MRPQGRRMRAVEVAQLRHMEFGRGLECVLRRLSLVILLQLLSFPFGWVGVVQKIIFYLLFFALRK